MYWKSWKSVGGIPAINSWVLISLVISVLEQLGSLNNGPYVDTCDT
jgi:hypothetical protein